MPLRKLKVVFDTSALISLETSRLMEKVCKNFDAAIPNEVLSELEEIAEFEDVHGKAAKRVLKLVEEKKLSVEEAKTREDASAFVDRGEAAALALAIKIHADYLVVDDCESLWYLAKYFKKVVFSVFVVRYLYNTGALTEKQAWAHVERMKEARTWGENTIYKIAKKLWKK